MKRIAILTSGTLPVPAVQGGAVENLVDFLLSYNDRKQLADITVYSIKPNCEVHPDTRVNHYRFYDTSSQWARIKRYLHAKLHAKSFYYNYQVEYYLHQALKDLRKERYDIVILESRPGYAEAVKRVSDARIVVHLHNDWMSNQVPKVLNARKCIDKVLTVSDFLRSRVDVIADGLACETVHNGIELERFYDSPARNRADFGFTSSDVVLVFSGRINKDKGVKELIDALKLIKDHDSVKLLVLGSSFFGEDASPDPFIESLKQEAAALAGRIVFTGFIPYSDIPQYLKMADVAVIPSVWEDPFPTTVLEAMAAGLPIVATNSGGIPESAGQGGAIIVDKEQDVVGGLKDAILRMLDPAFRKAMAEKSLQGSHQFHKDDFAQHFFESL